MRAALMLSPDVFDFMKKICLSNTIIRKSHISTEMPTYFNFNPDCWNFQQTISLQEAFNGSYETEELSSGSSIQNFACRNHCLRHFTYFSAPCHATEVRWPENETNKLPIIESITYSCLTKPKFSSKTSKTFDVLIPSAIKVHTAILSSLEHLQFWQIRVPMMKY